jgi:hypothetical protein
MLAASTPISIGAAGGAKKPSEMMAFFIPLVRHLQRKILFGDLIVLVLIDIFDKQIEKINNMKKIIIGVALIGIASLGFVFLNDFSALNNRIQTKQITKNFSKKSGTCGCIIVMKHSSSTNKEVSRWYEWICGSNGPSAKGDLQRKYNEIYSGTDFYISLSSNWVLDSYCD